MCVICVCSARTQDVTVWAQLGLRMLHGVTCVLRVCAQLGLGMLRVCAQLGLRMLHVCAQDSGCYVCVLS